MAQNPRFKAKPFATQEEVAELNQHLHEHLQGIDSAIAGLNRVQAIFEQALIKTMQDIESLSDVLVDVGILTDEEAEEEVEDLPEVRVDPDNPAHEADLNDTERIDLDEYLDTFREPDDHQEAVERFDRAFQEAEEQASAEGMPEQEDPEAKAERIAAARARRAKAVQEQGLTAFEQANEGVPAELDNDINSVTDVPDEGIQVMPGRDPFTGEATSGE